MKHLTHLFIPAIAALMTGCATHSEVNKVENEARDAQRRADQALSTAQSAKSLAQEANDRSLRTEEMLNRGFKRSMRK